MKRRMRVQRSDQLQQSAEKYVNGVVALTLPHGKAQRLGFATLQTSFEILNPHEHRNPSHKKTLEHGVPLRGRESLKTGHKKRRNAHAVAEAGSASHGQILLMKRHHLRLNGSSSGHV
jgi:hypothetical protein